MKTFAEGNVYRHSLVFKYIHMVFRGIRLLNGLILPSICIEYVLNYLSNPASFTFLRKLFSHTLLPNVFVQSNVSF